MLKLDTLSVIEELHACNKRKKTYSELLYAYFTDIMLVGWLIDS